MAFFKDFKAFLMKGDIVALATAVVIGAAFNKIVSSLVSDVLMPLIGLLPGEMLFRKNSFPWMGTPMKPWKLQKKLKPPLLPMEI